MAVQLLPSLVMTPMKGKRLQNFLQILAGGCHLNDAEQEKGNAGRQSHRERTRAETAQATKETDRYEKRQIRREESLIGLALVVL